ncbi:MAG: peptidase [Massilia sp.]|nr:peptidase [Massilia sp.]
MNWSQVVRTGIAAVAVALCISAQAASNGVTVSISTDKPVLGKFDQVSVNVTVANTSPTAQYVLKWFTPFGEIEESLFEVRRDGVKVHYLGARYKRPAPAATDYYLLVPGASFSTRVELSALYDMSVTGDYTIGYHARSPILFDGQQGGSAAGRREIGELKSQPVTVFIEGRQPRGTLAQETPTIDAMRAAQAAGSLAFNKCSASQQGLVTSAVAAGLAMANDGDSYLNNRRAVGPRYTEWFGATDPSRVATIKAHFGALKDAFATKPITVDCGCKKPYYAYVYPTKPYVIHVCSAFWPAPMSGTDSKGGTLVHEMSHFNVVAATDDWVYGQPDAADLAISDPAKAIENADSHEYFGENMPALP